MRISYKRGTIQNLNSKSLSQFGINNFCLKIRLIPEEERGDGCLGLILLSLTSDVSRSHNPEDEHATDPTVATVLWRETLRKETKRSRVLLLRFSVL